MANQQIYPSSSYPASGDLLTTPGSPSTLVTGWQGYPVAATPPQVQQIPVFGSDGVWHPEDPVVSGTDSVGSLPTKPPVQVAGVSGTGSVEEFQIDPLVRITDLLQRILARLEGNASMFASATGTDRVSTDDAADLANIE